MLHQLKYLAMRVCGLLLSLGRLDQSINALGYAGAAPANLIYSTLHCHTLLPPSSPTPATTLVPFSDFSQPWKEIRKLGLILLRRAHQSSSDSLKRSRIAQSRMSTPRLQPLVRSLQVRSDQILSHNLHRSAMS